MTQHDGHDGHDDRGRLRFEDPWYDALASGWGEWDAAPPQPDGAVERTRSNAPAADGQAAEYLAVHRGEAFQEVRRRHRRFVLPATVVVLGWYLGYVITATTAPELMGRPLGDGPFNVGMLAGLGQFATTALLTWAYAWNARLGWDRTALELRWETQQRTRGAAR